MSPKYSDLEGGEQTPALNGEVSNITTEKKCNKK